MRTILLAAGEMAHLAPDDGRQPLVGNAMSDRQALLHSPGMALVIEDGMIIRMAHTEEVCDEFVPDARLGSARPVRITTTSIKAEVWDLAGAAVTPGFIDAHTHLIWSGDRSDEMRMRQSGMSYQQLAEAGGGIGRTTIATRSESVDRLIEIGAERLDVALRHGTTSLEAKSGYGLSTESELALLEAAGALNRRTGGQRLHLTWLGAHAVPDDMTRSDYIDQMLAEQLPAVIEQGLAESCDVFCEEGWFTLEETESIVEAGLASGLGARLHVDEFSDSGGLALAAEMCVASADHAVRSSFEARAAASDAGVVQGFLPCTPYVLGSDHWPPIAEAIDNEWPWSLASDYNPNCRSISLPLAGSLAAHRLGIDPLAGLVAATRNPASTLPFEADVGVLVQGGPADLNVLTSDSVDGWCQTIGVSPCSHSMIDGIMTSH